MYIDDGVNVNPSWVNHIAVSNDGVNWDSIHKSHLSVHQRVIQQNNNPNARHPWVNKGTHWRIALKVQPDDTQVLDFDPNDIVNQPTWQGNTAAAVQKAVTDLTGWI